MTVIERSPSSVPGREGTSSATPLISARDLSKIYRVGEQDLVALGKVSLDIAAGDFVAIMGPSGSGKSTMMNLIGALDVPTSGNLVIDGRDTVSYTHLL